MLTAEQKQYLSKLPKATLINFVAEVQGVDKLLDKKIERLLLQSDKPKLIKKLTSNLKGLRRRHKFIEYWKINEFVTELQYLADDIMSLYPEQPETCLNLLELFLGTSNSSIERCEDSSEIEKIYKHLAQFWLMVAKHCYEQERNSVPVDEQDILSQAWQSRVKIIIDENDYEVKDVLTLGIKLLLSESEVRGLIGDYQDYYQRLFSKNAIDKAKTSYDNERANHQEKLKTETTLIGLASALGDVDLFETLYLTVYPKQQFKRLLQFFIDNKSYSRAQYYLNNEWQSRNLQEQVKRLDWLNEIYQLQGNTELQLQTLGEAFKLSSTPKRLKAIMTIASPAQQSQWRKKAYDLANQQTDIMMAVALLLEIGDTALASQIAVTRHREFADVYYERLTQLLKELPENTSLIQVIIYRSLIDDILDNARSKAYGHAARYYKKLSQLDSRLEFIANSYSSLVSNKDYIITLNDKHGKKYSFWERVND